MNLASAAARSASAAGRSRETRDRDRRLIVNGILVAVAALSVHAVYALLPGIFEPLKYQAVDRLFELRSRLGLAPVYDDAIVHVAIDDASLRQREKFYLDRGDIARLIRNLHDAGVAAQFIDMIYAAPRDAEQDRALIEATREAGNVYYGMALGLRQTGASTLWTPSRRFATFPELASASRGLGFLDIVGDRDGVHRRFPLLARDGDELLTSLALRVVCDYLGVDPSEIEVRPGRSITLPGARRPAATAAADVVVPIDRRGNMLVNYVGPWGSMKHYPFATIYEASDDRFMMEDLAEELRGRIALVSWVATGMEENGPVPVDPFYPLSGIHANAVHTVLAGDFLREWSWWQTVIFVELPLVALLLLAARRFSTLGLLLVPPALAVIYTLLGAVAFIYAGRVLDLPGPLLILAVSAVAVAAHQYHRESKARAVLRSTFEAYFPPAVVDKIIRHSSELTRTAQKKELTILFSDIRSFTRYTSNLEAGHVRELLNEYFERMIEIVFDQRGTLDKFIGDGLMVFFGDPEPQSDHAQRCVRAAIRMQAAAREIGEAWRQRGEMPLQIRIGINTGEVIVGNMGSERRLSYTALGEPVNLAQRLELHAPPGGILISHRTYELLGSAAATRPLEPIRAKGFDEPIGVHEVLLEQEQPEEAEPPAPAGRRAGNVSGRS